MNAKMLGAILGGLAFGSVTMAHADDQPAPKAEKKAKKGKKADAGDDKKGGEKSCSGDKAGGEKSCGAK
jgi:hypothetical protein